ncbi:bifunctional DNA primase/polymerase, partial [Mycolicibacterium frederiksbergense]
MVDVLGFHLIPLRCGEKLNAAGRGWNDPTLFPALTADAAVAHVAGGGNLGVLLGPSRLLVIDSEDSAATAALVAAGLSPTVLTAKGQCPVACDPRMDKRGGAHFWFVLPDGFDYSGIGNAGQVGLPGGGKVDVLVSPGAMVVVPPTVLIEAGGWAYAPAEHPTWAYGAVDPAPEWLFDAGAPCPESIASLSGVVAPVAPRVRALRTERDQEIDDAVDDIDWADVIVLAGGRIQDWGRTDSCGCSEYHWYASEKPRSLVTHDCGEGKYAFVPSLTMRAELGLSKDTCSSLTLACRLLGRDHRGESAREVGRMLGVELPPPAGALPGFHPNDFEAAAAAAEAAAVDPAVLTTVTLPEGSVAPPPVATDRDGLLAWAAR